MDHETCRTAVSARMDGEDPGVDPAAVKAHLGACAPCRAFAARAARLERDLGPLRAEVAPERSAALLSAMAGAREATSRRLEAARVALAVVAVALLVQGLPALVVGHDGAGSAHLDRHVGAFGVALAVGFLVVVAQPVRALGLLPMAAALGACMVFATALDLASGNASAVGEASSHVLELAGVGLLWALTWSAPRPLVARPS